MWDIRKKRTVKNDSVIWSGWVLGPEDEAGVLEARTTRKRSRVWGSWEGQSEKSTQHLSGGPE